MRSQYLSVPLLLLSAICIRGAVGCSDSAKIVSPAIPGETRRIFEQKLNLAKKALEKDPGNADGLIWYGRRLAYLGRYREAIRVYSGGIAKHPKDARFYRHRGHRLITLRCFKNAVADLEYAARLVKGKKDEVEPDGLPNARNIPTSTLQSNIWYHLGLAYYLEGDFRNALKAYRRCLKRSRNPDMFVATQNWHYLTLRRLGRIRESKKVLETIKHDLDIIENHSYYKLLKLYKGSINVITLLSEIGGDGDDLQHATLGYGIASWFRDNGDRDKAYRIFGKIVEGGQWASFGFIAAEAELK